MTQTLLKLSGNGLITGKPVSVSISPAPPGQGIRFQMEGVWIPAHPDFVINAERGVTLGLEGQTLSIVEHFLSACSMTNHLDLDVQVEGAPELPLLDGSALKWAEALMTQLGRSAAASHQPVGILAHPVTYSDPIHPGIHLMAIPADTCRITYLTEFPHPDLRQRWFTWEREGDNALTELAPARTFGFLSELPALQSKGLALGVTLENTLGLIEDGTYTCELRMPDEPLRHKILDLIGDLMLCGIPVQQFNGHIIAYCAGHASHLAFGKILKQALSGSDQS